MPQKLIEKITLPNGLVLELWDESQVMVGDRWLVSLLARVEVPISPEYFTTMGHREKACRDLVSAYGDPLVFTQKKVRHFVDRNDVGEVLTGICQRFKATLGPYLGNPKFASQFVLKKYGDLQDRQRTG